MSGSSGNYEPERWTVDDGLNFPERSGDSKGTSATVDDLLFGQISDDIPDVNILPTEDLLPAQQPGVENAHGYNLRTNIPTNPNIDFDELLRQQTVSKQHRLAAIWTKICNDVQSEIMALRATIYTSWDPQSAREIANRLLNQWKHLEGTSKEYFEGIKEKKRLETVQAKHESLKELANSVLEELKGKLYVSQQERKDDALETASVDCNHLSEVSSQKQKLRSMLLAKTRLELAKARHQEDIENAALSQQMIVRKEIRRLEEEVALAEVEWQVEQTILDDDENQGQVKHSTPKEISSKRYQTATAGIFTPSNTSFPASPVLDGFPTIRWSPGYNAEPNSPEKRPSVPDDQQTPATPRAFVPDDKRSSTLPATVIDSELGRPHPTTSASVGKRNTKGQYLAPPNTFTTNSQSTVAELAGGTKIKVQDGPMNHIAAMLKIQLLNGMKPTQFSGKPADFPFLRKQLQEHLESDLLTDAQRVEYLPKFLSGDALEVVKRNRGCSYDDLLSILESRYGQPIQVSQACIEDLISGPKLSYGDNVGLLNFSEKLSTATRILTGADEQEISVATNLRKIINRLPNDLIAKWQTKNYELCSTGSPARLNDIAQFVKKTRNHSKRPCLRTLQEGWQRHKQARSETTSTCAKDRNCSKYQL